MKVFGIDISTWQKNYPYDKANKEGVKFAILRAGFSRTKDNQFETHYSNAKRLGWGVGAYWYMYATTVDAAKAEAQAFLNAIKGKQFDYPVYLDIEDKTVRATGKTNCNNMIRAFGEIIEGAGYYFGVYTNLDWYRNVISGAELNKKYDWWIACWSTGAPKGVNYGLWQFGGETNYIRSNKVAGVVTDQNYAVKDYPSIIKGLGLNGYPKPEPTPVVPEPEPTPVVPEPTPVEPKPEPKPEPTPAPVVKKISVGDTVVVNGVGRSTSYGEGNHTRNYTNHTAKVIYVREGRSHPYALNCNNNMNGVTGWFKANDVTKI